MTTAEVIARCDAENARLIERNKQRAEESIDTLVVKHVRRAERRESIATGLRIIRVMPRLRPRGRQTRGVRRHVRRGSARGQPSREPEPAHLVAALLRGASL